MRKSNYKRVFQLDNTCHLGFFTLRRQYPSTLAWPLPWPHICRSHHHHQPPFYYAHLTPHPSIPRELQITPGSNKKIFPLPKQHICLTVTLSVYWMRVVSGCQTLCFAPSVSRLTRDLGRCFSGLLKIITAASLLLTPQQAPHCQPTPRAARRNYTALTAGPSPLTNLRAGHSKVLHHSLTKVLRVCSLYMTHFLVIVEFAAEGCQDRDKEMKWQWTGRKTSEKKEGGNE